MTDTHVLSLQAGHARYRAVELRAGHEAACAREDAAGVATALKAAGSAPIDADLPDDPMDAATELERRAYELTNPPLRTG